MLLNEIQLFFRLAWRNVWRHRRRTIIIVSAMSFGLAMMMMYDGLIVGFNDAIYGNAIKVLGGNIQVHAEGFRAKAGQSPLLPLADDVAIAADFQADPRVVLAARRINTGGLASSREGAFAVSIIGVEPEKEMEVFVIGQNVSAGRYLLPDDGDSIFIGNGLAQAMGVQVGDRITLTGRATHEQMRNRTMTVIGIYDLGMPDIEKTTIYMSLAEAQSLYDLEGTSTEIVVALKKLGDEKAVIAGLQPKWPAYELETYMDNYPELQSAIQTKGAAMNVFSVIILMIAGIGILNLLLMAIYERTREIGVLGALGLRPGQISLLFIIEGTMIGLVGVAAGIVLGLIFNAMFRSVGIDFSQFAGVTSYTALITGRIYPSWGIENLLSRALTVAIIACLASILPAREAAQREPAEALHYV